MCGFPLTIYLLSGWLQSRYPNVDSFRSATTMAPAGIVACAAAGIEAG
jgi:hypothetical protein